MSSRSIILLGIIATFSIVFVVAMSMGYANNNFLFQDGSTPLTANWDIGGFYITDIDQLHLLDAGVIYWGVGLDTYLFRQGVGELKTSGAFISSSLDTGQGANELYAMDQDVQTSDSPTFDGLTLTGILSHTTNSPIIINVGELTIDAGGEITVTGSYHKIDTFENGATDDLDTINLSGGEVIGQILILRASSSSRTVVVKDGTGNIELDGGVDFSLDHARDTLMLLYDTQAVIGDKWIEISRSNNN